MKREIRTGKKLGDVGASFSNIFRSLLFYLAPCALLDVADVLSATNFGSIPVFLKKETYALHLKNKLCLFFHWPAIAHFCSLYIFCFIESQVLHFPSMNVGWKHARYPGDKTVICNEFCSNIERRRSLIRTGC